jgi:hypothetical protein
VGNPAGRGKRPAGDIVEVIIPKNSIKGFCGKAFSK